MASNNSRKSTRNHQGLTSRIDDRSYFLTQDQFRLILNHEKARSDRHGTVFSILLVRLSFSTNGLLQSKRLVDRIRDRTRIIDQIGAVDESTIGVLLVSTDRKGAAVLDQKLKKGSFFYRNHTQQTILVYPEDWHREAYIRGIHASFPTLDNLATDRKESEDLVTPCYYPWWKRGIDIVGSLFGFLFFAPAFLFLILYIKLVSPGPAIFRQERIGYRRTVFPFMKFRTMHVDSGETLHRDHAVAFIRENKSMDKLDDLEDFRIIPGGKLIRRSGFDELPQLVNILRGEMSLVGPRPCLPYEAEEYLRWHRDRFNARPGLTGLWQVKGKNRLSFAEMIRLDIKYMRKCSPAYDLWIMILTLPVILIQVIQPLWQRLHGAVAKPAGNRQVDYRKGVEQE